MYNAEGVHHDERINLQRHDWDWDLDFVICDLYKETQVEAEVIRSRLR